MATTHEYKTDILKLLERLDTTPNWPDELKEEYSVFFWSAAEGLNEVTAGSLNRAMKRLTSESANNDVVFIATRTLELMKEAGYGNC